MNEVSIPEHLSDGVMLVERVNVMIRWSQVAIRSHTHGVDRCHDDPPGRSNAPGITSLYTLPKKTDLTNRLSDNPLPLTLT